MITYTLNQTPIAPARRFDGASEEAKLMAEVFERLLEIEEEKFGEAASLVRRLAVLADVSPRAFVMVLRFGSGDTGALLASYEEQVAKRGCTRQAAHWQWQEDIRAIKLSFPQLAELLGTYRENIRHKEDAISQADGLRSALEHAHDSEPEQPEELP